MHGERSDLAGHESGQDHLGLYLYNGNEYLEGMLGAYKARVAPFNVNYRYVEEELALSPRPTPTPGPSSTTPPSPPSWPRSSPSRRHLRVLLQVADESGNALLPGAVDYEAALAAGVPDGPPGRAVPRRPLHPLHRRHHGHAQRRAVAPARHLPGRHGRATARHLGVVRELRAPGRSRAPPAPAAKVMSFPPLMHGAAQWARFYFMTMGPPWSSRQHPTLDPVDVWQTIEREQVIIMTVVGDAMVRPLLEELDRHPYDQVSSLFGPGQRRGSSHGPR